MCGFCAVGAMIPRIVLQKAMRLEIPGGSRQLGAALAMLQHANVICRRRGGISIPLSMSEPGRQMDKGSPISQLPALADALGRISFQGLENSDTALLAHLAPHLRSTAGYAEMAGLGQASILWTNLGAHLHQQNNPEGALDCYLHALAFDEKLYSPTHSSIATDSNNLGLALQDLYQLDDARKAFERALEINRTQFGEKHPKIANRYNNLGCLLSQMGDVEEAKGYFERALENAEKTVGNEHPRVATILNNLGMIMIELGDVQGAQRHFLHALGILKAALPPDHPDIQIVQQNIHQGYGE